MNYVLGNKENYHTLCVPLYWVLVSGDWEAAKVIFTRHPELVRYSITSNHDTPLHISVYNKQGENFLKELVGMMDIDDLKLQNKYGKTALFVAAEAGNLQMAKTMVDKDKELLNIPDSQGRMPLSMAALHGKGDMVTYLYDSSEKMKDSPWTHENRECVFMNCIGAHLFDIAQQIVNDWPELAASGNALRTLARMTEAFKRECNPALMETFGLATQANSALLLLRSMCDNILELPKNDIGDIIRGSPDPQDVTPTAFDVQNPKYISQLLFFAVEVGNTAFVSELISRYPDRIQSVNDKKHSLFHVSVSHRHKDICTLLYKISSIKDSVITLEDENGNNVLHLVGERPKRFHGVSNVVQQMQQELQWFEEVKAILPPYFHEMKNNDGLTPLELFTKTHKDLVSEGEKLLKEEAEMLMRVVTVFGTIALAVPLIGPPIFLRGRHFTAFMVLDALSFIFSVASILVLRSMRTSRYAERDFLQTLTKKHLISLATLINAFMTLATAFYLYMFVLIRDTPIGGVFGLSGLVFIASCLYLQYPLFVSMFGSRGSFFSH
ncbi:hypothetical protein OSB04_027797 [Centaurea solstitialis]|uniref:PGG domain-containing protein n=1 Tax=Centaurea solstitialis TaxID=347529 RepID=A0AA38SST6_9ASTR|nr:hypothetical protein OSB04_027797 [Centaurea solstitialis]